VPSSTTGARVSNTQAFKLSNFFLTTVAPQFGATHYVREPLPVVSYAGLMTGSREAEDDFLQSLTSCGAVVLTDMPKGLTEHLKPLQESFLQASLQEIPKGFHGIHRQPWDGFHNKVMLSMMSELYPQFDPNDPKFEIRDSESYFIMPHSQHFPNDGMAQHGPAYQKAAVDWGTEMVKVLVKRAKELGLEHADSLLDMVQSSDGSQPHAFHTTRLLHYPKMGTQKFDELEVELSSLQSKYPKFQLPKALYQRLAPHYDEDIFTLLPPELTAGLEIQDPKTKEWISPNPTGKENRWVAIAGSPLQFMTQGTKMEVQPAKHRVIAHKKDMDKDRISFATKIQVHPKKQFVNLETGQPVANQPKSTIAYYHKIWTDRNSKKFDAALTLPTLKELEQRFDALEAAQAKSS
jgi:isopenicillin N synthase-like dioxygenase